MEYITIEDDSMYDFFEDAGFTFSPEILSRYYLSLKTKPFTILTGISGTGKTKIAQIFANYMCQKVTKDESEKERKKRIALIPVRPDWMDNRGLLGYYNVLQEKYVKTPLLELLLEAKDNPTKPHFIILDEMNLAKVEYYFSDFLSIMESRMPSNNTDESNKKSKTKGEKIFLYDKDQVKDEIVPYEISIPNNVYFTGTVNVDESTYMFSPKVLDRANVIEFNQVTLDMEMQKDINENKDSFSLKQSNVIDLLHSEDNQQLRFVDLKNNIDSELIQCSNSIVQLLMVLEPYNMHFGYRVADEMSRFILLASNQVDNFNWQEALDIQILQKVLPKLHGTRAKLEKPMTDLISFCENNYPRSLDKLKKMQNNLDSNGYTSFIE